MSLPTDQRSPRRRRSLRLPAYDYSQPGAYFVTIVTYQRQLLLADLAAKSVIDAVWNALPGCFDRVVLDAFVVMPNHLHGILIVNDEPVGAGFPRPSQAGVLPPPQGEETSPLQKPSLGQIVAYFKYQTTKRINGYRGTPGLPVWQRNYYEHVVRNEAELGRVRRYIRDNPARWDLDPENPARTPARRRGDS